MFTNRLFAGSIVVVLMAVAALTILEAIATSAVAGQVQEAAQSAQRLERRRQAETARWKAMGDYYSAMQAQRIQRSHEAAMRRKLPG